MKLPRRKFLHLAAGAAALPATSRFAWARANPTRSVGIHVPFPAGQATNTIARLMGQSAPAPAAEKLQLITEFFDDEIATGKLPGAVILIQQHGRLVYLKCFGVRDVTAKLPMTPDTIFALHSMTKPITSLAAMMLIDAGKIALDDPVSK